MAGDFNADYMSRKLKIALASILFVISAVCVTGIIVSWYFQDDVKELVVNEINKHINTRINVNDISFSVLRKFPRASVEFRDILVKVPDDFVSSGSNQPNDTLFSAQNLFLQFNLKDIIRGRYRITDIHARNGVVFLEVNHDGRGNYFIWKTSEPASGSFNLDLQNLRFSGYRIKFNNLQNGLLLDTGIRQLEMKGNFRASDYRLAGEIRGTSNEIIYGNFRYNENHDIFLKGILDGNDELVNIEDGVLEISGLKINASGKYLPGEASGLSMDFHGSEINIGRVINLLPVNIKSHLEEKYKFEGKIDFAAEYSKKEHEDVMSRISADVNSRDGKITRRDTGMQLTGISFSAGYNNGDHENRHPASIIIRNFSSVFGNGSVRGNARIVDPEKPSVEFDIIAFFLLEDLAGFHQPANIHQMAGRTKAVLSGNGQLEKLVMPGLRELSNMNLKGTLEVEDGMLEISKRRYIASDIDGIFQLGRTIKTPGLSFYVENDHYLITGEIDNGFSWLLGDDSTMSITGSLYSQRLGLDKYFLSASPGSTNISNGEGLLFPENVELNLDFLVDDLSFRAFSSSSFSGKLSYKPRMLVMNSVGFHSMEGRIEGNGVILQRHNGDFMVQSQLQLQEVDMHDMFRSFNNFGQAFIQGDNLKGRLTGNINLISEWDKDLQLKREKIVAESKVEIKHGELVDFEPVLGLSRFIDIDELRHIRFSTLNNEIFIRDQVVTIPLMDINSSAFNIGGSGIHRFDGHFDYRLQVLLSDVLFGRAGKSKPEVTKFGIVEEDGPGASLRLLVSGTSESYDVSWDRKAAVEAIKDNISNERNVLRQLLHHEFGWFASDSTVVNSPDAGNTSPSRFRIVWDEEDEKAVPAGRNPDPE